MQNGQGTGRHLPVLHHPGAKHFHVPGACAMSHVQYVGHTGNWPTNTCWNIHTRASYAPCQGGSHVGTPSVQCPAYSYTLTPVTDGPNPQEGSYVASLGMKCVTGTCIYKMPSPPPPSPDPPSPEPPPPPPYDPGACCLVCSAAVAVASSCGESLADTLVTGQPPAGLAASY